MGSSSNEDFLIENGTGYNNLISGLQEKILRWEDSIL